SIEFISKNLLSYFLHSYVISLLGVLSHESNAFFHNFMNVFFPYSVPSTSNLSSNSLRIFERAAPRRPSINPFLLYLYHFSNLSTSNNPFVLTRFHILGASS